MYALWNKPAASRPNTASATALGFALDGPTQSRNPPASAYDLIEKERARQESVNLLRESAYERKEKDLTELWEEKLRAREAELKEEAQRTLAAEREAHEERMRVAMAEAAARLSEAVGTANTQSEARNQQNYYIEETLRHQYSYATHGPYQFQAPTNT